MSIWRYALYFALAGFNGLVGAMVARGALSGGVKINDEPSVALPLVVAAMFLAQGVYWLLREPKK